MAKRSNWKGGSFKAAVGGFLRKKLRSAGKRMRRSVAKSAKRAIWA